MSIVTVKTVKKTFVDFVDVVDAQDLSGQSEEDAATDKHGTCTWPVARLRAPSNTSSEEHTATTRTPQNDDEANSDAGELETGDSHVEPGHCEAGGLPSAEEDLWLAGYDPAATCELSFWLGPAAPFKPFHSPPPGLGHSLSASEPAFLPASWLASGAELLNASGQASPLSAGASPPASCINRLRQLNVTSASPARAFEEAPLHVAQAGASNSASAASAYATGDALVYAANAGRLPMASWAGATRWPVVVPHSFAPAEHAAKVALAQAAKVRNRRPRADSAAAWQAFQREDPNRLERRRHPARQRADGEHAGPREPLEERTTIMLRNIPNNYTRDMLRELIEARGFGRRCDFLYLPMDFHTQSNLGYAFVNLATAEDARRFWGVFEGFDKWAARSKKVGSLRWSECQGLEANVKRYRNSPVMGDAVPDRHKPVVYAAGERIEFPAPTKPLQAPRIKQAGQR